MSIHQPIVQTHSPIELTYTTKVLGMVEAEVVADVVRVAGAKSALATACLFAMRFAHGDMVMFCFYVDGTFF